MIMKMIIKMKMIMNRNNFMTQYIHHIKQLAGTAASRLRHCLTLILLLMGTATVWGQTDFSGIWYIANETNHNNTNIGNRWYLVPGGNPQREHYADAYFNDQYCNTSGKGDYTGDNYGDPDKPFLTTYQTSQDLNSIWIVVSTGDGYYNIIHAKTGYYIVYEPPYKDAIHRKSMHLESTDNPGENAKFTISGSLNGPININPKSVTSGNMYFNPAVGVGNRLNYFGTGDYFHEGMIGLYNGSNDKSQWYFEDASPSTNLTPVINEVNVANNTFTITSPAAAFSTISYTTNGSTTPDAVNGTRVTSGSNINITDIWTVQAVGVLESFTTPVAGPKVLVPTACVTPVIRYDYSTSMVTITCPTPGSSIYYNIGDGTQADPTDSSTPYSISFSINTPTTIKAIATSATFPSSAVSTLAISQVETPTIQDNGSHAISITTATPGATIYYTTDGNVPSVSSNEYTGPLSESLNGVTIKAIAVKENMITSSVASGSVTLQCETPTIVRVSKTAVISCGFPTSTVTVRYTTNGNNPNSSSSIYTGAIDLSAMSLPITIKAYATATGFTDSEIKTIVISSFGSGTPDDPYTIASDEEFVEFVTGVNNDADKASAYYQIKADLNAQNIGVITSAFRGTLENTAKTDGTFYTISNLSHALFNTVNNGTVKNVMLKNVSISGGTNAGAICNEAIGNSRIYNCGILPSESASSISGSESVGSLVGLLDGTSRVINCFSFATVSGGSPMGGIVGNNAQTSKMNDIKTIVVNCMFYGEITGSGYPVYGGKVIENSDNTAINNYNYYRGSAAFDDNFVLANYNRSWPAEERNLTRFEYYRSILNSNRRLCTWWVNGTNATVPTDDDVATVGIAKWVLDPSIAPYPILKEWGKYPSIINPDPNRTWDPEAKNWQARSSAQPYRGKSHGTLSVTVSTGSYPGTLTGLSSKSVTINSVITEMDTLNYDYGYYKIQLPYYNEVFGDPNENNYLKRYYGNYTGKTVTGWKITEVTDDNRPRNSFVKNWENGYNYADRNCTEKDIYSSNDGRAFAQGGYYYVPEGVTAITIEAYWGSAFYLHGKDHALDRVNVTKSKNYGTAFTPSGTLSSTMPYGNISIYEDFNTLMNAVKANKSCNVYDQAVVLVGNYPLHAQNDIDLNNSCQGGFTIMSADFDMDNEPDFCMPLQWRTGTSRNPIMPIRFDFLPIPELGLVMRHNTYAYALGIFVPQGHFEITETAFMHTTQFEYMSGQVDHTNPQPLILNGGQFEQIVTHGATTAVSLAKTRNIILGGHLWMKRFSPGSHTSQHTYTRHCAVSVMGGDFPEFYLTGIYWTAVTTNNAYNDSPHCYTNGGKFGIMAGAGMEAVKNNVHFEIDHSVIDEFYGGGINSNNPVAGNIEVTINNSLVLDKYCGGPKVGTCGTVTTNANGTIFNQYFGGGNGGTNLYREQIQDLTPNNMPNESAWNSSYGFTSFTPISNLGSNVTYDANKGYHAEFEFEVFNQSNGLGNDAVARSYRHWAQFGTTTTGNVTNVLEDCLVEHNFYGGGNLALVNGLVNSTLRGTTQIIGSAFGAGYSASVPHFSVHDKASVTYPTRDGAGVCHNGELDYLKDDGVIRQYTWCYKNPTTNVVTPAGVIIPDGVSTSKPAFQFNGKWYCYTTVSLENLGTVTGNVTLNIQGSAVVEGFEFDENNQITASQTGGVFGGGDASGVIGNIDVNIAATGQQTSKNLDYNTFNVFGGGNKAIVDGSTNVTLTDGVINNNVFGGGNEAEVTGSTTVNIEE